ncbi:Vaculolar membrane protein-domain-containing protein [Aspergillus taichungensis]|uniref:Vaculolar membrane protein-domain-containing protein n=1 Tax=Aspergillus taichungensis TaxID=482145 RepID=A0A2J5HJZ5_9EURO|nr:Vaculolar membrane protein-domain-containing protein [Aspergillus taichungensis]
MTMTPSVSARAVTAIALALLIHNVAALADDASPTTTTTTSPSPQKIHYPLAGPDPKGDGEDSGECRLLGPFSLFVQAALGALALLSLVYKRWRERPQRPVKVWAFDVSKQVFGSAMLHLANLLMSMFSAGQLEITSDYRPNPCSFYILNLGIDTTLGIPILIFILYILNRLASYTPLANPPESIQSGHYGRPPRATWWFKQSMIYFVGLLGMKICVFFLIQLIPFIVKVGDWALRWTEGNPGVQIFFVMLLFPLIMNAVQYYIIDTFIKKPARQLEEEESRDHEAPHDERGPHDGLLAGLEDDTLESDDESGKDTRRDMENSAQAKEQLPRYEHEGDYFSTSSSSANSSAEHNHPGQPSLSTKHTTQQ